MNARRRLESKILELQQEYQVMRSTYSRLNASCISQSQYDSNRYVTGGYQPNDVTTISPMPLDAYNSQVNIAQMSARFDRSDLLKERSSQYDAFINYS